jgi:two-component sensor histidine kinase
MMKVSRVDLSNPNTLLMLEEVTHRVNNELTAAICVVSLAAKRARSDEVRLEFERVSRSLQGFANVQRALEVPVQNKMVDVATYLRTLCRQIAVSKLSSRGIELVLNEHFLRLQSFHCWVLGMIVSELVSNSFSHAFGEGGGTISIEVRRFASIVQCRVEDDGAASASQTPALGRGRGHRIVSALADWLDGTMSYEFTPAGSRCTLTFSACSSG